MLLPERGENRKCLGPQLAHVVPNANLKEPLFFPNIFSRTVFHSARKKMEKAFALFFLPQFILHFQQSLPGPLPVATSQRASTFGQARLCMLCFVFVRRHRSLSFTHQEGALFTASECEQKVLCKRIRQGCIDPRPGSTC